MNRYRIRKVPDFDALCLEVYERQQERERSEFKRLDMMLECLLGLSTTCQTRFLIGYFGEEIDESWKCGTCHGCKGKKLVMNLAPSVDLGKFDTGACLALMFGEKMKEVMVHDECRTGARFLCGIASPLQTKAKINKHGKWGWGLIVDYFGKLEGCDFESVLELVRGQAKRLGVVAVKGCGVKAGGGVKRKADVGKFAGRKR
jgi:hypothetical protein